MASSRHPRFSPRSGRHTRARQPSGISVEDALTLLQAGIASLATTRQPSSHKLSAAAIPEKCAIEMTSAGFRSWRRSVESWLRLAGWPDREAVLHIRLLCVPKLQCALDARFDSGQWEALTPKEALDAIGKLVLQASNQAVKWCDFFSLCQGSGESVSVYMTRCAQEAADCGFQCPTCDGDLTEYMLLRKVMVGLSDLSVNFQFHPTNDFLMWLMCFWCEM